MLVAHSSVEGEELLQSNTVFGVKASLLKDFEEHRLVRLNIRPVESHALVPAKAGDGAGERR